MTGPDLQNDFDREGVLARVRKLRAEIRGYQREAGVEGEGLNLALAMIAFAIMLTAFAAVTPNTTSTGEIHAPHLHQCPGANPDLSQQRARQGDRTAAPRDLCRAQ